VLSARNLAEKSADAGGSVAAIASARSAVQMVSREAEIGAVTHLAVTGIKAAGLAGLTGIGVYGIADMRE
jgi:hypothetical protein